MISYRNLSKVIQQRESQKVENYLLSLYEKLSPGQREQLKEQVTNYASKKFA